jgi:hypothetical protein
MNCGLHAAPGRWPLFALLAAMVGCGGGVKYPEHDGYPTATAAPWKNPQAIALDAQNEVDLDDSVSYPQRKRAKWFAIDVPVMGALEIKLSFSSSAVNADPDAPFDLAFELLDGNYNVVTKADPEDQDVGTSKKTRAVPKLKRGRYYLHVYTLGRMDEADFNLHVKFTPAPPKPMKEIPNFPAEVAYVPPLPAVPPIDDAPPPPKKVHHGGHHVASKPTEPTKPEQPETPGGLMARISQISDAGGKTKITISRGSEDGVDVGWKGYVVNKAGKRVSNGGFTVTKVTSNECEAIVSLSFDDTRAAGRVMLKGK